MDNRKKLLGIVVVVAAIVLVAWLLINGRDGGNANTYFFSPDDDPRSLVVDFYEYWLQAAASTSTNPYDAGLTEVSILTPALKERLAAAEGSAVDPVLCQETIPEGIRTRVVYELDDSAQILVTYREATTTPEVQALQTIITFERSEMGWLMNDITCSSGESEEVGEFSFEREGNLLKSVPAPLNSDYWHLVYEENGQTGNAAPLFFDESSVCIAVDGTESTCDTNTFVEAQKVFLQAQMTEAGPKVKRLQFIQ